MRSDRPSSEKPAERFTHLSSTRFRELWELHSKPSNAVKAGIIVPNGQAPRTLDIQRVKRKSFSCSGCPNQCRIDKYSLDAGSVFHGGRCDRWEVEGRSRESNPEEDLFGVRSRLLDVSSADGDGHESTAVTLAAAGIGKTRRRPHTLGIIRSPHFYEWFPFWKAFWHRLGFSLRIAPPPERRQFEQGTRFLKVETCLPMKMMAGQIRILVDAGVRTIFHPAILSEKPFAPGGRPVEHCPYIQASSQFFKGSFDIQWLEPVISYEHDPDSFRNEHIRLAEFLGATTRAAENAFEAGMAAHAEFQSTLESAGGRFLAGLGSDEQALLILGKPYHTSEPFLNMNLGSLFRRLGVKAIPGDIFPLETYPNRNPIAWKHQLRMIGLARAIAGDPRLFPVLITFFGCGPDPFTVKHIKESLKGKPLLVLEMDEHSSRAGIMTRLEAFLDHIKAHRAEREPRTSESVPVQPGSVQSTSAGPPTTVSLPNRPAEDARFRTIVARTPHGARGRRTPRPRNESKPDTIFPQGRHGLSAVLWRPFICLCRSRTIGWY